MAARTTKAELEAEIARLNKILAEQSEKITELLQAEEGAFLHSYTHNEMQQQLKAMRMHEETLKWKISRLESENEKLRETLAAEKQTSPASASKRGRKPTVSEKTKTAIRARHTAGQSIREIAEELGLKKSTVHRALHT